MEVLKKTNFKTRNRLLDIFNLNQRPNITFPISVSEVIEKINSIITIYNFHYLELPSTSPDLFEYENTDQYNKTIDFELKNLDKPYQSLKVSMYLIGSKNADGKVEFRINSSLRNNGIYSVYKSTLIKNGMDVSTYLNKLLASVKKK